jgi:2-methylcitrate dehydratase PrpD
MRRKPLFTARLAQFINQTNYQDLPEEVVKAAKTAILDFSGVMMAGSQETSGKIISEIVRDDHAPAESTVVGSRFKTRCSLAALANGSSGHDLDFDDCLDFPDAGLGHPTTGIFPAVLAVSEKLHLSGKDVITAYCLGLEAYAKTGLLTRKESRSVKGWEWTGVLGVIGATAAVSKLLKLDEQKIVMSLGIATSLSSGLIRNFGTMAGHLHAGNAARNGVEAGFLAQKGYDARSGMIETSSGFYNTYTANPNPLPPEVIEENISALGNPWNIIDPGLMFKAFPCAHISHFGVDAALQLRKKHAIDWRQIAAMEYRISPFIQHAVIYTQPQSGIEGKFSLGYCLCRALIEGKVKISHFTDENVNDVVTHQLMNKVKMGVLEQEPIDTPFGYQELKITMNSGETYSCRVAHPLGEPQNPLNEEQHVEKYRDCAQHAKYDIKTASRFQELVMNLEAVEDVTQLTQIIG